MRAISAAANRRRQKGPTDSPRALVDPLLRRWWLFLLIAAGVFAVILAATLQLKPVYSAEAGVKLDPTPQHSSLDVTAAFNGGPPDSALIDTEVSLMRSREVAIGVAQKLNLVDDPEFNPRTAPLLKDGRPVPADPKRVFEGVVGLLQKKVSVARDGATYIVHIDARANDPVKAATIANAVADEYLLITQSQKMQAGLAQQAALSGRAKELQAQAEAASAAVVRYKAAAGLIGGGPGAGTVTDQQAGSLAGQLAQASAESAAARAKATEARAQISRGALDSVAEVLSSPVITDLRRQRTETLRDQAQINGRYGPKHPDSVRVASQLAQIDAQIVNEADRIVSSLESAARASEDRVRTLRAQLGGLEGRQASNARASVEADTLQRRADSLNAVAAATIQVVQRANEQAQVGQTQGRIAFMATPPASPSFPNKPLFVLFGLLLGGVLGAATVYMLDLLDSSVRTPEQVETLLGAPYLASIPLLRQRRRWGKPATTVWDYVKAKPISSFAESLRLVRSAMTAGDQKARVIAITSALPGEGKTSTAISLARVMAMSGDRVLLIDGDLRRNALQALFKQKPTVGLIEVLTQSVPFQKAVIKDTVPRLDVLPLVDASYSGEDLLGGPVMARLIAQLRQVYDHIIIDTPPALAVADARRLAALADAVIMAVRWGRTPRHAALAAIERLEGDGLTIGGVILTMVDIRARASLGEGDTTYYYKASRKYYVE
jgi:capsular exopolysaccharide synthesis family protein